MLGEKPPAWTTDTTAKFTTKSGTETVTAFQCLLDDGKLYTPCVPDAVLPEGEQQYADLAEAHTFHVWAMDADLGTTLTPNSVRTYTWPRPHGTGATSCGRDRGGSLAGRSNRHVPAAGCDGQPRRGLS